MRCNLCLGETELTSNLPGFKQDYLTFDRSQISELSVPTVDYFAPPNLKHNVDFNPHYIFMIDISNYSNEIQFSNYVNFYIY